jgi:hypothetical protein
MAVHCVFVTSKGIGKAFCRGSAEKELEKAETEAPDRKEPIDKTKPKDQRIVRKPSSSAKRDMGGEEINNGKNLSNQWETSKVSNE